MESTVTANAMSLSLLARNVYGVCFTMRDSRELLRGELAQARRNSSPGGAVPCGWGKTKWSGALTESCGGSRHTAFIGRSPRGAWPWRSPSSSEAATCW